MVAYGMHDSESAKNNNKKKQTNKENKTILRNIFTSQIINIIHTLLNLSMHFELQESLS